MAEKSFGQYGQTIPFLGLKELRLANERLQSKNPSG